MRDTRTSVLRGLMPVMALLLAAGCATTTPSPSAQKGPSGYVTDASGNVVRNATGQCWRTGYWQPAHAVKECDPQLVQQAAPQQEPPSKTAQAPTEIEPEADATTTGPANDASADTTETQATAEPEPAEPVRVYVGTDAYFEFDQAELTPRAQKNLEIIAERAQEADELSIRIVGYADRIGDSDYNYNLSQRRADAVRTYFIERGLPETALSVDALGQTDPIVGCEGRQGATLIDCLQPNRRAEVEFSALEPPQ